MSIIMAPNPPTSVRKGTVYIDDNTREMRVWDGTQWQTIGGTANDMANNYQQFAEEIENLTEDEAKWVFNFLAKCEAEDEEESDKWCTDRGLDPEDFYEFDRENWPGFSYSLGVNKDLWLHGDENFNIDNLAHFVQEFLKKWRPTEVFKMTYSSTCDKMRIGEFGGGWMVVSAYDCLSEFAHEGAEAGARRLLARIELEIQSKVESTDMPKEV